MQRQVIRCGKGHLGIIDAGSDRLCPKCGGIGSVVKDGEGHATMPFKQANRLVIRLEDEARTARRQGTPEAEAVA